MADTKISDLTHLNEVPAATDEFEVVDKSDTGGMGASGTNKRVQFQNLYDWAESGDLSVIEPDDAAAAGSSIEVPRADHKHAIAAAAAATLSGTNAEGSSTSFARADHNHALPAWGPVSVMAGFPPAPADMTPGVANTWYAVRVCVLSANTLSGIRYQVGIGSNGNARCALFDSALTKVADKTTNTTVGAAGNIQALTFDSTYAALPGFYYSLLWFSASNVSVYGGRNAAPSATGTNATTTPSSIGTPSFTGAADRPFMAVY